MNKENRALDRVIERCVVELFAAYDVTLAPLSELPAIDSSECTYMGLIGFSGETLRGTVLLAPTTVTLLEGKWQSKPELRSWVGELANQLLGRIKNQLLRYGVEIYLTMPITIRGSHLSAVTIGELKPYVFDAAPGLISVWVDLESASELQLTLRAGVEHHLEGDALEF